VRYYVAMKMAEHGLLTAPNMACGEPFNIGITTAQAAPLTGLPLPGLSDGGLGALQSGAVPPGAVPPGAGA